MFIKLNNITIYFYKPKGKINIAFYLYPFLIFIRLNIFC